MSLPAVAGGIYRGTRGSRGQASVVNVTPSVGATSTSFDFPAVPSGFERLRAAPTTAQLIPEPASQSAVWAYENLAPGPEIRVMAGERVRVRLENSLPQDTAVHWHGISIDNAMDGVPGLTQDSVPPGEVFDYDFVAPYPGTYWYHTHDRSWEQNARGLHGALVVEEAEPYEVDREVTLVIDDWKLDEDGAFDESSLGSAVEWSHDGRMGTVMTINGRTLPTLDVTSGERIRFRLINTANARIMGMAFGDLPATLVALDGHPVSPRPVGDYVLLSPAQRADVVVDMTGAPDSRAEVELLIQNGSLVGVTLAYGPEEPIRDAFPDVPALPDDRRHEPIDLDDPVRLDLLMEGGAMGGLSEAMMDGRMLSTAELSDERRFWAFNGVAGGLDDPLGTVPLGRTAVVVVRNETAFPHAMHLHGHHFQVLNRNGTPDPTQDWRDTELVGAGEAIEIAFVADNPGKWLLHCHMLEHAVAGMVTWFEVT